VVAGAFFVPLYMKVGPRRLRAVRVRVFEKGSSEPYIAIAVIVMYGVFAALIVLGA